MPRYSYPSKVYVATEQVGTKYDRAFIVNSLKNGSEALRSNENNFKSFPNQVTAILGLTAVLFFTGCRISEALQLKYSDIKLEDPGLDGNQWITLQLLVEKRKQVNPHPVKVIPLLIDPNSDTAFILKWLIDWYRYITEQFEQAVGSKQIKLEKVPDELVFPYKRVAYYKTCAKYFKINPHGFRKIAAQYMVVEKNMPLKTVQKILGHSSLMALDYYINLRTEDLKKDLLKVYKGDR